MDEVGWICGGLGLFTSLFAVLAVGGVFLFVLERVAALSADLKRLRVRLDALEAAPVARIATVEGPASEVLEASEASAGAEASSVAEARAQGSDEEAAPAGDGTASDAAVAGEVGEPPPIATTARPRPAFELPSPERIAVFLAASVGGLALVVGGLFAMVAVLQSGLLGPALRVCLGLVGGTVLWTLGALLRSRFRGVASALEGAGMGVLFGASFAAHGFYGLVGPLTAFAMLAGIASVSALRAAVHHDRFMAWLGLVGGLLAPVLVSTGNNGAVGLFTYLTLLLLGNLSIAGIRRWPDLVLGAAFGAAGLYAGWTAAWYGTESVGVALVAAFALQVPFAGVVALVRAREGENDAVRVGLLVCAVAGAALFPLLAVPWVFALDASFTDPRTGLTVIQEAGPIRWFGALALSFLPLPLWVAGRVRSQVGVSAIASMAAGLLTVVWAGSWAGLHEMAPVLLVGAIAPLAVGLLVHVGNRRTGAGLLLSLPAIAIVLAITPALDVSGAVFATAVVAVVFLGAAGPWVAGPGALSLGAVLTVSAGLAVAAAMSAELGATWVLGASLVSLGGLSAPALFRRWSTDRFPSLPWLGALLAGPAVFPALYVLWEQELGVGAIGLLPLLLGVHGLLTAVVLVRGYQQPRHSPLLALAVAIALLGTTFALPIQLQEKWLTVGWALEGLALAGLAVWVKHPLLRWSSVALGLVIGVRLLINPYALAYGDTAGWPVLNWTLYTWGVPTLTLVGSAWLVRRTQTGPNDLLRWAPPTLSVLAMLTGFALVNVEVSHAFQDAGPVELGGSTMLQGMVRSLAWASWGLFLLVLGFAVRSRMTRFIGFAFLMLSAGKVFVYDIYSLPGFVRVGSFLGLGVLLIFSALLFDRVVMRVSDADPEEA